MKSRGGFKESKHTGQPTYCALPWQTEAANDTERSLYILTMNTVAYLLEPLAILCTQNPLFTRPEFVLKAARGMSQKPNCPAKYFRKKLFGTAVQLEFLNVSMIQEQLEMKFFPNPRSGAKALCQCLSSFDFAVPSSQPWPGRSCDWLKVHRLEDISQTISLQQLSRDVNPLQGPPPHPEGHVRIDRYD